MKTIAWDVDDVLNDLMRAWLDSAWRPVHSGCALRYEACSENPPHRLLGVSLQQYRDSLDAFRLSEKGRNLPPDPGVLAWFERYGDRFRHIVLTSTPLVAAPYSAAWVMRHFGKWIRSFHFVPSPRPGQELPAYDLTKADFLVWFGQADLFVDDHPEHVAEAEKRGIRTLLAPRPWNQGCGPVAAALEAIPALLRGDVR